MRNSNIYHTEKCTVIELRPSAIAVHLLVVQAIFPLPQVHILVLSLLPFILPEDFIRVTV